MSQMPPITRKGPIIAVRFDQHLFGLIFKRLELVVWIRRERYKATFQADSTRWTRIDPTGWEMAGPQDAVDLQDYLRAG